MATGPEGKITEDFYVADTGSSCHVTNSMTGMFNLRTATNKITVGNGQEVTAKYIGDKVVHYRTKNGKNVQITLRDVKYAPEMFTNLFSVLTAITNGWNLTNKGKSLVLQKDGIEIIFDTVIRSGNGIIVGTEFTVPKPDTVLLTHQELHS